MPVLVGGRWKISAIATILFTHLLPVMTSQRTATGLGTSPRRWGGERCQRNCQCFSGRCQKLDSGKADGDNDGVCGAHTPLPDKVAGGGECEQDSECFSGFCDAGICAADSAWVGMVAAGGLCMDSKMCASGVCYQHRCGPESGYFNRTAAGGYCVDSKRCHSKYCYKNRCAPDSVGKGSVADGGTCLLEHWCLSRSCFGNRCAPSARLERKVADGGSCLTSKMCRNQSVCYKHICLPRDTLSAIIRARQEKTKQQQRTAELKVPGDLCESSDECEAICYSGRCAVPSRIHKMVADGGACYNHSQCFSGYCDIVCAPSYSDHIVRGKLAAGATCDQDWRCNSGVCDVVCSPDAPRVWEPPAAPPVGSTEGGVDPDKVKQRGRTAMAADDPESGAAAEAPATTIGTTQSTSTLPTTPWTPSYVPARRNVAAGGHCRYDDDCFSNYCDNSICGPNGPGHKSVAGGGVCSFNNNCYSGYCHQRRCVTGVAERGLVAPGARCGPSQKPGVCAPPSRCVSNYCLLEQTTAASRDEQRHPDYQSIPYHSLGCWMHMHCMNGSCDYGRCSGPWYMDMYFPYPLANSTSSASIRRQLLGDLIRFSPLTFTIVLFAVLRPPPLFDL